MFFLFLNFGLVFFVLFVYPHSVSQVPEGAGLAAQAGHDDDCAASDHCDGVHPV